MEFEQSTVRIVVIGRGKTRFHRLKHGLPGCQETIPRHPLKPAQRRALHVEGGHGETLRIGDSLVVKELLDFKNPTEGVLSVEPGHLKLHMRTRVVERRWGGRRFGGGWICSEAGKAINDGVEFAMEVGVSLSKCLVVLCERSLVLGEFVHGILEPFKGSLAGCVLKHGFE